MNYQIEYYRKPDNPDRTDVIGFMWNYNDEFADMEISLVEQANKYLTDSGEKLFGREGIVRYYDSLCDELVVVKDEDQNIVACRFVQFDEEDEYFRERVDDYATGLNLTFALVDLNHRGNGLWGRMLKCVEERIFPRYDVDRMYLATATTNNAMQSAAIKEGFQCINTISDDRKDGVGTYIYMKRL